MDQKSCKSKIVVLGILKKMAFKFSRYLEKHGRYSLSKLGYDASRPKIETLLPRPLEVRATSNLGHFILPYRTSIVPSFIKIGDFDFQEVIDLTWTDPKCSFFLLIRR